MRFDVGRKMSKFVKAFGSLILLAGYLGGSQIRAQQKIVSAKVTVTRSDSKDAAKDGSKTSGSKAPDISNVAIWLVPLDPMGAAVPVSSRGQPRSRHWPLRRFGCYRASASYPM